MLGFRSSFVRGDVKLLVCDNRYRPYPTRAHAQSSLATTLLRTRRLKP